MELSLGRKLPLLISALILFVLLASSGAAYLEVDRSATSTADDRVTSLSKQLADLVKSSVSARGVAMRRVASDSAVQRLLRSRGTGALDVTPGVRTALERLVIPTDSTGFIEVWDASGHSRARYAGSMMTAKDDSDDFERTLLASHETATGMQDSVRTGAFYARGDSVYTWYVQPVVHGASTTGFVAQRVRLTNDASAKSSRAGLSVIMGPGVDLYLANTSNDFRTTTIGEISRQPQALKLAHGPTMYSDPLTGEMLGAKTNVPLTPWVVEIAMPRAVVLERPLAFLRRMSIVALITLLIGALLAWAISRQVTQPLAELTAATNDLSSGEYDRRVYIVRGDELGKLGDAFNLMAERVSDSRASSEQQRAEAEAARRDAVAASQAKSDFLAVMSHELRTPLNAILGFSSLMIDGIAGPLNDQQVTHLTRIRSGGQHLLSLIDEILSLTRLEAQREEVHAERHDAFLIARESAALAEPMAKLKGLTLVTSIPSGTCECHTDSTKVRQILLNLLSNAIKFTNEGTVSLSARVHDADVFYTVSDTGIGVAPEHRWRIFEPFFQVEMSKARRVAGTGLGLSVTRHLATLLGGDIYLCDQEGSGSTFEVRIPRFADRPQEANLDNGAAERSEMTDKQSSRRGVAMPRS